MYKRILLPLLLCMTTLAWAEEKNTPATISSVNFLQEGEVSKLIIDTDKYTVAERLHVKTDKQIILDLKNATADKKFMRGIDTSEFSGSTVYISPYKKPGSENDLRFAIQLRDNVRSYIENKKNRIILHIENRFGVFTQTKINKAQSAQTSSEVKDVGSTKVHVPKTNSMDDILENLTQSGVKRYVGRKISLDVNNITYQEVLTMIGDTSGFNIIIEDEVTKLPKLTISLTNLPWDQVLDTIMDLGNLVALKHGNILTITTAEKARDERQKELDMQNKNKVLEPLVTKIFPISYTELENIAKILGNYSTKDRGTITLDERTQNLIVKDTVEAIERMKKIIETLDTQTPQILIEAKIVEVQENYEFRAGLSAPGFSFSYDPVSAAGDLAVNTGSFSFNSATSSTAPSFLNATINVERLVNLAFQLDLMESESKGKIVSSPKVITENNKLATINNSTSRNFRVQQTGADGATQSQIQPIQAEIALDVTPKVTNEGSIAMKVDISKSGFTAQSADNELPSTTNREVKTNVLVENGSTVVIGGIYQTEDLEVQSGIPFLKDLPLVGWLFRTAYNPSKTRNELIIFLTPRVINQEEAGLINRSLGDDLGI